MGNLVGKHQHRFTVPIQWITEGNSKSVWEDGFEGSITSVALLRCETCNEVMEVKG